MTPQKILPPLKVMHTQGLRASLSYFANVTYSFENYTLSESILDMNSGKNLRHALSCQPWFTAIQCISNILIKDSYENCKESRMLQQGSYVDTQVPKAPLLC